MPSMVVRIVFALLVTTSCGASTPSFSPGGGSSLSGLQQGIPPGDPSINGVITAVERDGRFRVEEKDGGGDRAAVLKVTADTRLLHRDGRTAALSDLAVGVQVSAWYVGPVAESFPVQATAGTIVVERGSRAR